MSGRRITFPRNEASRRDKILSREIIFKPGRDIKTRNDMLASNVYTDADNATIALTGTAISGGVTEEMIVDGGETIIITITNDTWAPTLGANNAITTAFLAAITGDDAGSNGFDAEVALVHGNLTRTNANVLTLTLPAVASYAIAADETITVAPPNSSVVRGIAPAAATFDVTFDVSIALTGTAITGGVLESEIVTGSQTVIVTISGDTWAATLAADNAITTAFLAAIVGDLADAAGWNAQMALAHGDITRTTANILTIILPATAGYSITTGNETVTVPVQADAVSGGIVPVSKTFVITEGS